MEKLIRSWKVELRKKKKKKNLLGGRVKHKKMGEKKKIKTYLSGDRGRS
jgi:hypothetical protein